MPLIHVSQNTSCHVSHNCGRKHMIKWMLNSKFHQHVVCESAAMVRRPYLKSGSPHTDSAQAFPQRTQGTKGTYIGSVGNSSRSQSSSPRRQENFKRRAFGAGANGRAHGERAWERNGNARCEHACTWPDCSVIEKGSAFEPKMHSFRQPSHKLEVGGSC